MGRYCQDLCRDRNRAPSIHASATVDSRLEHVVAYFRHRDVLQQQHALDYYVSKQRLRGVIVSWFFSVE